MGKECFIPEDADSLNSHSSTLDNFLIIKSKANGPPKPQTLGPVALDERSSAFPQILENPPNLKP
jgi:hypothetical protein